VIKASRWAGAAMLLAAASAARADKPAALVTTPGTAELTICRDWLVYDTCDAHHITLPKRVAVGDKFQVTFGSNPKMVEFHVIGIRRHGKSCTLLSPHTGANESGEKIVADCRPAAKPAAAH
jgi:hypothetical protein